MQIWTWYNPVVDQDHQMLLGCCIRVISAACEDGYNCRGWMDPQKDFKSHTIRNMEVRSFQDWLIYFQNLLEDPGSFHLLAVPTSACWLLTSCLSLSGRMMVSATPSFPMSPEVDISSLHPWRLQWPSHDSLTRLAAQARS